MLSDKPIYIYIEPSRWVYHFAVWIGITEPGSRRIVIDLYRDNASKHHADSRMLRARQVLNAIQE